MREAISSTRNSNLATNTQQKRNKWMTDEILLLIEERRLHKNRGEDKYKKISRNIKTEINKVKKNG